MPQPLECLIIPELARIQAGLEQLGYPHALDIAFRDYNDSSGLLNASGNIEAACDPRTSTTFHRLLFLFRWVSTPQGEAFWKSRYADLSGVQYHAT